MKIKKWKLNELLTVWYKKIGCVDCPARIECYSVRDKYGCNKTLKKYLKGEIENENQDNQ